MSEETLHRSVVKYLQLIPGLMFYHPANGGKRSKSEAGRLKAMGVRPGVPDLCFVLPTGVAAFIELKDDKGRVSEAQSEFGRHVMAHGARWAVARSLPEVEDIMARWLVPFGWPVPRVSA